MRRPLLWLSCCWLLACGHSPDPVFYALSPQRGAVVEARPLSIELRRPSLPSYLDRPHIVRRVTSERLELAADERWAAPLEDMFGATLAENLAERLPNASVFAEAGSISALPDVRVEVQVARFELVGEGSVRLVAEVAVHWAQAKQTARLSRQSLSATPRTRSTADLVTSMSLLLGQMADAIALTIERGPPAESPSPSGSVLPPSGAAPPILVPGALPLGSEPNQRP